MADSAQYLQRIFSLEGKVALVTRSLASDTASSVNGLTLHVDGGLTAAF